MTVRISKGDTNSPTLFQLMAGTSPPDLSGATVKHFMLAEDGTTKISETTTGLSVEAGFTVTANTSANCLVANNHLVANGNIITLTTTGTLPAGLSTGTRYRAVQVNPDVFALTTMAGTRVVISSAGSGTHTAKIVGSVQKTWAAANVNTEGRYQLWFRVYSGSDYATYPVGAGIPIEVVEPTYEADL